MSSTNATTSASAAEAIVPNESPATILNDLSRLTISDTALSFSPSQLEFGDLLFYPKLHQLLVVTRIDSMGIYLGAPDFSMNHKPGTWTLSGGSVKYTPVSPIIFWDPIIESEFIPNSAQHIILNPTGAQVRTHYFNSTCPWMKCDDDGFICTCQGVEGFEELNATCEECAGVMLACPVCHGREFALEDMLRLRQLALASEQVEKERIWKDRCERVDAKREELGLEKFHWGMTFELEAEHGECECGHDEEGK